MEDDQTEKEKQEGSKEMIIMTEKKFREEMEKEKQRAFDDAWKMDRENRMMERIYDLERRVDKLEGKEEKCCCETATPVR